MDRQPVGGDDRERQPGDPAVEVGHRRGVDEAQPHPLPGTEEPGPVRGRRPAVREEGVGLAGDIGDVAPVHPHRPPGEAFRDRRPPALPPPVPEEVEDRRLVPVVVMREFLEFGEDPFRVLVGPVGEDHDLFPVVPDRVGLARFHDDRPVEAALFLERRVAVVPVGARLPDAEPVGVGFAGENAVETEPGDPVLVSGQQDAVPMDRGDLVQGVLHPEGHRVAFAPAERRRRERPVDGDGPAGSAGQVHRRLADGQVELGPAQLRRAGNGVGNAGSVGGAGAEPPGESAGGEPGDELPPGGEEGRPGAAGKRAGKEGEKRRRGRAGNHGEDLLSTGAAPRAASAAEGGESPKG